MARTDAEARVSRSRRQSTRCVLSIGYGSLPVPSCGIEGGGRARVHRGAEVVADHAAHAGLRPRIVERAHLAGVNTGPPRGGGVVRRRSGGADAKEP